MRILPLQAALLSVVALLFACRSTDPYSHPAPAERLADWMTGSFSSAAQAGEFPDDYLDIRLHTHPIWTDRSDGPWLYVEQAAADAPERPYRQRVYHLVRTEDGVRSDIYELPGDPLAYAGSWATPADFDGMDPAALVERAGCSIELVEDGRLFRGSTDGSSCPSELNGASYATSEVVVAPNVLTSWDRGYDAAGEQVWGAVGGPYVFVKDVGQ